MGEHYRTSDLYYAAFLKTAGVPLYDTVRESGKVVFLFEPQDSQVMRDLKRGYFGSSAKVLALDFAQAVKLMKTLTHMEN